MAKDVITRFKLETTAFDSKIKQAAKGLSDYAKTASNAGNDFDKFTKSNVEAARALGTMATSSNNTKGKLQELVGAYNEMAKTYEHLTKTQQQSDFGKAMAESLTILQQRIKDTKQELYSFGEAADEVKSKSSGLFGDSGFTGMLAVTGGNLLASGIQKLGAEMADTIQQSVELARQGEGIRLAFERLNQPGLLDNLKEATHGTVSELELMKQAVKFDDFNLPVEQLGTLLAFAQKKAKDTGQSVDYMVDSIVTGLGRKSLMILDNLGLSASDVKEKMKETGDMTKAVAAIIKEQMGEAGEYVETAADRAARAAADATNEMERLGREAQPFAEEWAKAWNEIKIGGMQLLTTIFGPLAESARQIRSILNGGGFKFKVGIPNLADGPAPSPTRQPGTDHKVQAQGGYVEVTDKNTGVVIGGQHFNNLQDANSINTWKKSLFKTGGGGGKSTTTTGIKDEFTEMEELVGLIPVAEQKVKDLQQQIRESWDEGEIARLRKELKDAQNDLDVLQGKLPKDSVVELTITANTSEALQKVKEIDGVTIDPKTMTVTANTSEALQKVQELVADVGGKVVNVKVVPVLTDADIDKQLQKQYGKAIQVPITPKLTTGEELVQSIRIKMADQNMDADIQTLRTLLETQIKNGIEGVDIPADWITDQIFGEGMDIPDETWQALQDQINEKLRELQIDPIKIDFKTGNIEKQTKQMTEDWKSAASAIQSVGSAMAQIEDPMTKVIGTIAQAVATMALSYAQAAASPAVTGSGWGWIAFAATGVSTMLSSIAAIKQATAGFYAEGGIVPGNNHNDGLLAHVSSGELILNRAQQNSIASQLEGGMSLPQNIQLETRVDAEELIIMLNNNGMRRGLGKLING